MTFNHATTWKMIRWEYKLSHNEFKRDQFQHLMCHQIWSCTEGEKNSGPQMRTTELISKLALTWSTGFPLKVNLPWNFDISNRATHFAARSPPPPLYVPTKVTTFKKAVCTNASAPSLFLALITAVFARSGFIQREKRKRKCGRFGLRKSKAGGPLRSVRLQLPDCSRTHWGHWISRPRAPPFCHTLSHTHTLSPSPSLSQSLSL